MIEVIKTAYWFARRPTYWPYAFQLAKRKLETSRDTPELRKAAGSWAAQHAVSVKHALIKIGVLDSGAEVPRLPSSLLKDAELRANFAPVKMGGPGDLDLLYASTLLTNAERVIETGVAYGWSSLAILAALEGRPAAQLVSVDMPYPKMNNDAWVGIVVPDHLKPRWSLIREPDRHGLEKAIARLNGSIDVCHYDSDKSYQGRQYGYRILWQALSSNGLFISDDIQDNFAFREFSTERNLPFAVTEYQGKYVGIIRKQ